MLTAGFLVKHLTAAFIPFKHFPDRQQQAEVYIDQPFALNLATAESLEEIRSIPPGREFQDPDWLAIG